MKNRKIQRIALLLTVVAGGGLLVLLSVWTGAAPLFGAAILAWAALLAAQMMLYAFSGAPATKSQARVYAKMFPAAQPPARKRSASD